jgi:farnesyl-diphosphate farnesyltransferase
MEATVGLAYLLCRILDTVEDSSLPVPEKQSLLHAFLEGLETPSHRAKFHTAALSSEHFKDGHDAALLLIATEVLGQLHRLEPKAAALLYRCVREMGEGMAELVAQDRIHNETQLAHYCHVVAGTVGELLTGLYLLTHTSNAAQRATLWAETESFAQGLQRVNIAKDVAQDQLRNIQFIPGFSANDPNSTLHHQAFCKQTLSHLEGALRYTLAVDSQSPYRCFCALPLMLAVQTLAQLIGHPEVFSLGKGPKIPREETMALIEFCREHAGDDERLAARFHGAAMPLRAQP